MNKYKTPFLINVTYEKILYEYDISGVAKVIEDNRWGADADNNRYTTVKYLDDFKIKSIENTLTHRELINRIPKETMIKLYNNIAPMIEEQINNF